MAENNNLPQRELEINELLCYASKKFKKLTRQMFEGVIYDFYKAEEISNAKDILVNRIDKFSTEKWPKPPKRKQTESNNKALTEVEDIYSILAYIDRNLLWQNLPVFVAEDVDNLPSNRLEENDMRFLISKFDKINSKIDSIMENSPNVLGESDMQSFHAKFEKIDNKIEKLIDARSWGSIMEKANNWPVLNSDKNSKAGPTSQPLYSIKIGENIASRPRGLSEGATANNNPFELDDETLVKSVEPPFQEVISKRRAKEMTRNKDGGKQGSKFKPKVFKGSNPDCDIKAARQLIRKKVYCISNLAPNIKSEQLKSWLEDKGITVYSVYEAKTKYKDCVSYRVCINLEDVEKFTESKLWSDDIRIREWVFKHIPQTTDNVNNENNDLFN